jgi:hypothetical protein
MTTAYVRDITLEFKLLPRLMYALQEAWACGAALVVAVVCALDLFRDGRRILQQLPISMPQAVGSLLLLTFVVLMGPAVFASMLRNPVAFSVRLEIRGNTLFLIARSGRHLREIKNVVADVRYRWKPTDRCAKIFT